jgi:hypothetical protein
MEEPGEMKVIGIWWIVIKKKYLRTGISKQANKKFNSPIVYEDEIIKSIKGQLLGTRHKTKGAIWL